MYSSADVSMLWHKWGEADDREDRRDDLREHMERWARREGVELDDTVCYSDKCMDEMLAGKFNPGGHRACVKSVHKGVTPISNMSASEEKTEEQRENNAAWERTRHNATHAEDRARDEKGSGSMGPAGYYTTVKMVTLFAARLCALFTRRCSLYVEVNNVRLMLLSKSVRTRTELWTTAMSRKLMWAIISDCREFFDKRLTLASFRDAAEHGEDVRFPQSNLHWTLST